MQNYALHVTTSTLHCKPTLFRIFKFCILVIFHFYYPRVYSTYSPYSLSTATISASLTSYTFSNLSKYSAHLFVTASSSLNMLSCFAFTFSSLPDAFTCILYTFFQNFSSFLRHSVNLLLHLSSTLTFASCTNLLLDLLSLYTSNMTPRPSSEYTSYSCLFSVTAVLISFLTPPITPFLHPTTLIFISHTFSAHPTTAFLAFFLHATILLLFHCITLSFQLFLRLYHFLPCVQLTFKASLLPSSRPALTYLMSSINFPSALKFSYPTTSHLYFWTQPHNPSLLYQQPNITSGVW